MSFISLRLINIKQTVMKLLQLQDFSLISTQFLNDKF